MICSGVWIAKPQGHSFVSDILRQQRWLRCLQCPVLRRKSVDLLLSLIIISIVYYCKGFALVKSPAVRRDFEAFKKSLYGLAI